MTENKTTDVGMKIFIARQPIFDSEKKVFAYEILYRSDEINRAYIADEGYATLKVIANSLLIGLQKLTAGKRAFINFNRKLLLGKIPMLFPRDMLGVEILESVEPDKHIIRVCEQIKRAGYPIILDDLILKEEYAPLIQLADIIKIDFKTTSASERENIIKELAPQSAILMAEKVETGEQYDEALKLGCKYFQGFFFRKPDLVTRKDMPGYKLNYLSILKKIHQPFPNFEEIEEVIKRDVSLTYKLLRFINSASYGFKVTIRSIHHALILLGKREVKKWLTIIVMSGIGRSKPTELMNTVIVRARFCELIAEEFGLTSEPSDFFLVGMFSLMEAFIDQPIAEIIEELPLEEDVKHALIGTDSPFTPTLKLVEMFEKADWERFTQLADQMALDGSKVAVLYVEAVEWAKFLSKE
jgi:EAL and modified HD-GYP domain-containing signal transduction protein